MTETLLDKARRIVRTLREKARDGSGRRSAYASGQADVIEELIRYAEDRDKEISRLVREVGLLRAKLEAV